MLASLDPASSDPPTALVGAAQLTEAAQKQAATARNLHGLLCQLCAAHLYVDAARLLMRVLPKRYAVAWVRECYAQDAERVPLSASDQECVRCVERWIADGSEEHRQAAAERAGAGKHESGAEWLAAAVGWTGGSLAPRGYALVAPAEHLTADACFASLCLLAAREPAAFGVRLSRWLERAVRVFGPGQATTGESTMGATRR